MKNRAADPLEITVIVSTYNRPDTLDLMLSSLAEQDYANFEVVVADDGSGEATASLIRAHQLSWRRPLHHVWQPDEGFRLSAIRNRGILKATGKYIVFLDGDCIARTNWLSWHAALAQRERFVTGSKIKLSPAFTNEVLTNRLPLAPIYAPTCGMDAPHRKDQPLPVFRLSARWPLAALQAKIFEANVWLQHGRVDGRLESRRRL